MRYRFCAAKTLLSAAAALVLGMCTAGTAEEVLIDEVVAVVNGEIITRSQVEAQAQVLRPDLPLEPAFLKEALRLVIDETIIRQEAQRRELSVSEGAVQSAYVETRGGLTQSEFLWTLQERGLTPDEFRELLRQRLLREQLFGEQVSRVRHTEIVVSDEQARSFCESLRTYLRGEPAASVRLVQFSETYRQQLQQAERVHLAQIVVSDEGQAGEIRQQIAQGEDFGSLAEQHSLDPSARQGGDIGWFTPRQIDPGLRAEVLRLSPGETTGVIPISGGYYRILKVLDQRELSCDEWITRIVQFLEQQRIEAYLEQWVDGLRSQAQIFIADTEESQVSNE